MLVQMNLISLRCRWRWIPEMTFCPGCEASITQVDIDAARCTQCGQRFTVIDRLASALTFYRENEPDVRQQAKFISNLAIRYALPRKSLVQALLLMSGGY
jgi:predicted amidophosphoribosyltransferase